MTLADWLDCDAVSVRLVESSMRLEAAESAAERFLEAATALRELGIHADAEVVACWAPGRVEVFGKHTDYCGGQSLLAAAERGFAMLAAPRVNNSVCIKDARTGELSEFALRADLEPVLGHWSNYPQTVARRVATNFPDTTRGADIAFASNLPPAAGMSSSSAFVVGTFLWLSSVNRLCEHPLYKEAIHGKEDLAGYISTIENGMSFGPLVGLRGVGTFGGSEDHTAILCGKSGALVAYTYCPVQYVHSMPMDERYAFAIASSGVVAEKTGAALESYNRVSLLVRAIVELWQISTGNNEASLAAILASSPQAPNELRSILESTPHAIFSRHELLQRLDHFEGENYAIQGQLPAKLDSQSAKAFGKLAVQSHRAADILLKNQTPETNRLVEYAVELGAYGASAFGAGFGGSVWA